MPSRTAVSALKPIRRRQRGGRVAVASALTGLLPSGPAHPARSCGSGRYEVAYGGRYLATGAKYACCCLIQLVEVGGRHDLAGVEHVAVPEAAELCAVDLERPRPLRLDVGDVVDARVRVGLHSELVGPERVDRVQRGDVQPDQRVRRQDEVRRLDAPVGRVAERPLPLLSDHLHVHRLRVPGRKERGRRPLASARAALEQLVGAEAGEEQHRRGRHDDPGDLDPGVAADRRAVDDLGPAGAERRHGVDQEEQDEHAHGRDHAEHHLVAEDLLRCLHASVPRRDLRTDEDHDQRRHDRADHEPEDDELLAVRPGGCCSGDLGNGGHRAQTTFRKPSMYPIVCIGPPKP